MKKKVMNMLLATVVMIGAVSISATSVQAMENITSFDWDVDVWEDLARTSYESEVFKEYKEEKKALKAKREETEEITQEEVPETEEAIEVIASAEMAPEIVTPEVIPQEEVVPEEVVPEAAPLDDAANYANISNEFINLLNVERAALGLPALQNDAVLKANAEKRAKELVNDFSHNGSIYTECCSMSSVKPRATDFLWSLMDSPVHWSILTGVLPAVGVGIYEGNGNSYIAIELDGESTAPIGTDVIANTNSKRPPGWYDSPDLWYEELPDDQVYMDMEGVILPE